MDLETCQKIYQSVIANPEWKNGMRVPISVFNDLESFLRPAMRALPFPKRAIYRGPRIHNRTGKRGGNWASNPSMTRRMDAKFVDIVSYCK